MIRLPVVIDKLVDVQILVEDMQFSEEAGREISALSLQAEELLREVIRELRGQQAEYKLEGEGEHGN